MPGTDKRKQSLYFPEDMLNEIQAEANRQDSVALLDCPAGLAHLPDRDHALSFGE